MLNVLSATYKFLRVRNLYFYRLVLLRIIIAPVYSSSVFTFKLTPFTQGPRWIFYLLMRIILIAQLTLRVIHRCIIELPPVHADMPLEFDGRKVNTAILSRAVKKIFIYYYKAVWSFAKLIMYVFMFIYIHLYSNACIYNIVIYVL